MLVAWRTIEILALLSAVGLPINLLLLSPAESDPKRACKSARILLAPVAGIMTPLYP
jgi:hypothetical protein